MDKPFKFILPSPNFNKKVKDVCKPKQHYLTPSGMSLLPREKQPPPMYGKHGATYPSKYLKLQPVKDQQFEEPAALIAIPETQYCEACELELHSLEDLKRHRAQHENCPVAGCDYKGHPTVMDKHINALHASGLFDKFKKLSTPEEIAAWREQRRKRYPTLANVLLKQKAKEQRQKRGERLESSKSCFGDKNDKKRTQNNTRKNKGDVNHKDENKTKHNKRNRKNKHKKSKELKPKIQNKEKLKYENLEVEDELCSVGFKMFGGTSQFKDYKHFNDKKKIVSNVLYGLVGMYGSDDDEQESEENYSDEHDVKEMETMKVTTLNQDKHNFDNGFTKRPFETVKENKFQESSFIHESKNDSESKTSDFSISTNFSNCDIVNHPVIEDPTANDSFNQNGNSSDEAPEETPIQRSNPDYNLTCVNSSKTKHFDEPEAKRSKPTEKTTVNKQKKIKRKSGLDYRKLRLGKQNTMLEKLIESDIRHERNVLLQCVRFVCENNFFNIGQNKNQKYLPENDV